MSQTAGTDSATIVDGNTAGRVRLLLETHFSVEMGFLRAAADAKRAFVSLGLNTAITAYCAVLRPADEVPPIKSDPFTNSQQYPTRFKALRAQEDETHATVEVVFASAWSTYPLVYRLIREVDAWKLDDIVYPSGYTFQNLLTMP